VKAAPAVCSIVLVLALSCAVGTARADRSALHGAARGPLALAATQLFTHFDDAHSGLRLAAPGFAHALERSWSVAPDAVLMFDSMVAVLELASVLAVVPALPRLDGRARLSLARRRPTRCGTPLAARP